MGTLESSSISTLGSTSETYFGVILKFSKQYCMFVGCMCFGDV